MASSSGGRPPRTTRPPSPTMIPAISKFPRPVNDAPRPPSNPSINLQDEELFPSLETMGRLAKEKRLKAPSKDGYSAATVSRGGSAALESRSNEVPTAAHGKRASAPGFQRKSEVSTDPQFPKSLKLSSSGSKSWSSLFPVGRPLDHSSKCVYSPPELDESGNPLRVSIPRSAVEANNAKWSNTLAGYVVGNRPFYAHLRACVHRLWKPKGKLSIHSRDNGFFFFVFELEEDCTRVLEEGPWLFDKRVIVLRLWTPHLKMDRDLLSSVPVWVRFPDLPLSFWSPDCIGRIASYVGNPLFVDKATAAGDRFAFARCFVEIEAKKDLPKTIDVVVEDGAATAVNVEYESIPSKCSSCICFGHTIAQCTFKKVWVAKSTFANNEESQHSDLNLKDVSVNNLATGATNCVDEELASDCAAPNSATQHVPCAKSTSSNIRGLDDHGVVGREAEHNVVKEVSDEDNQVDDDVDESDSDEDSNGEDDPTMINTEWVREMESLKSGKRSKVKPHAIRRSSRQRSGPPGRYK